MVLVLCVWPQALSTILTGHVARVGDGALSAAPSAQSTPRKVAQSAVAVEQKGEWAEDIEAAALQGYATWLVKQFALPWVVWPTLHCRDW